MDEVEWWEFDSAAEMAEQAAGDIAFVIDYQDANRHAVPLAAARRGR